MARSCFLALFLLLSCRTDSGGTQLQDDVLVGSEGDPAAIDTELTRRFAIGIGDIFRFNYQPRNSSFPQPAVRAAFRRTLGCAKATFEVLSQESDLVEDMPMLFRQEDKFTAWVRISRDRTAVQGEDDFDQATTAFAIKILPKNSGNRDSVPTEPVPGEQDFILQNHPVFFAKTAKEFFLAFASQNLLRPATFADLREIMASEPVSQEDRQRIDRILAAMAKDMGNSFRKTYWSVTPYRFGSTFAKFRLLPVLCQGAAAPPNVVDSASALTSVPGAFGQVFTDSAGDEPLPDDRLNREYLRQRLERDLGAGKVCFEFQVQRYRDAAVTPLDNATVNWDDNVVGQTVARLTLHQQDPQPLTTACETARFSPDHAARELAPVGSINFARQFIYQRFSRCRQLQNSGQQDTDEFRRNCFLPQR